MNGNFHINLNAIILLVVFSINTLLGFAAAVLIDLGFNAGNNHYLIEENEGLSKTTIAGGSKDDQYINDKKLKYYISCNI